MGIFGNNDDKKRQAAGSSNGGQFAPDTSGKTPPASDPLNLEKYTAAGGATETSAAGVDAAHAAFQAKQSEEERLISMSDEEMHGLAVAALRRGTPAFAAQMTELRRIAKLKSDRQYHDRLAHNDDDSVEYKPYRIPLQGMDFSGVKVSGINFDYANLDDARFNEVVLKDCTFNSAAMKNVTFTSSTLQDCDFSEAQLLRSDFATTTCETVSFKRASMTEANFAGARMIHCDFRQTMLDNARMESVTLTSSNIEGARMATTRIFPLRYEDANGTPNWT